MESPVDTMDPKVAAYVREVMQRAKPYLYRIEEQVMQTPDGIVHVSLRINKGKVTDIIVNETRRIKL